MNNQLSTKVVTGTVRLTFPHLFRPYANQNQPGQEPKYSVTMLLPKTDLNSKAQIDAAINAAIERGISDKWNGQRPAVIKTAIHDGDGVRPNGEPFGDECKGHWVFTASSKQAPEVVMYPSLDKILNESEIYSGMYALVSLNFFPYNTSGNRGVGIGLNNVAKVSDGEPLGGRTSAASDFGGAQAATPQQSYQQPQQGYQAPQQYQQQPQTGYDPYQADTPMPPQLGGQPQQQTPQYQQPVQQQNYQQPVQQQQLDPITGQPIGGVYGV